MKSDVIYVSARFVASAKSSNSFQYPFHPMSTDTCRRFHLEEIAHVWSEYAPVIELLTHETLLIFVNKSHHRPSAVLARRISTMTGCLPLNIPLSCLYVCVPVPLILTVVMLLAASLHWQVNDVKNGDHDVLNCDTPELVMIVLIAYTRLCGSA